MRRRDQRVETLTVAGGEVLPVFSYREEAEMFLRLGAFGVGWQARPGTPGELVSGLRGPLVGVGKVALDPPPEVCGSAWLDLVSLDRRDFLRTLAAEERRGPPQARREPAASPVA